MKTIKNIIFDFGDIFINLDYQATKNAFKNLGLTEWNDELQAINQLFEKGMVSEETFLSTLQKYTQQASLQEIKQAWNALLSDFPMERLEFLENLQPNYTLFLLSNTDSIHIQEVKDKFGLPFFERFYNCFTKVYFSFEMHMRKPDVEIFEFVITEQNLNPTETLFIDDRTENTQSASKVSLQTWNLQVGKEDVRNLFKRKNYPIS